MEVRLLGPFEVREASDPIVLGGVKQRAVLAMLALRPGEIVSIGVLTEGLWGDDTPESALNIVQVYVSQLRRALGAHRADKGAELLQRRGPGYAFSLERGAVDLFRFEQLIRDGNKSVAAEPERAAATLRGALDLWRGPPLAEFRDMPFAREHISRIEELRLTALTIRFEADLALGRHVALVGELEAHIAQHPLHEGLREQLIKALYRSGRQAEALAAYRLAQRELADELGIDPGPALKGIEAAILAHDPGLDWVPPSTEITVAPARKSAAVPSARPGGTEGLPQVWNVPPRNPHFTGRAGLLDTLHQRLQSGERQMVVQALYGLGGVGKTQLAIEYAHRFVADYDLVWWIDAEQLVLIPPQFTSLARWLGIRGGEVPGEVVHRVLADLGRRRGWLLVFDNADRPADIAKYVPGGSGHVLVTSRTPDWGALGGRVEVDVMDRGDTVALLRSRIPDIPTDIAEKLAGELGDLPLATAQAAAFLEQTALPPTDYLRRFQTRRADLLTHGDVLGYQGRVDTAWTLSLERLRTESPVAVALLEFGAFLGQDPIPLSLFAAHPELLEDPLRDAAIDQDALVDAVGAAVAYSMVRRRSGGYQMHRLVQAVIRHRLPDSRRQAVTRQVLDMLAAAHPGDPNNIAHWAEYARLAPHVLALGPLGDDHPESRPLMLSTLDYLNIKGDTRASRLITEDLLDRWRRVLGPDHPDSLTVASNLTLALVWGGEGDQARDLGEDTLRRSTAALGPEHPETLAAASNLILALAWVGRAEQACILGQQTLRANRELLGANHPTTLAAAAYLTSALGLFGDSEQACEVGRDTLERARQSLGVNHFNTLITGSALAYALLWLGRIEPARELAEDTLERARSSLGPDHPSTLRVATTLGFALVWLGEKDRALAFNEDMVRVARQSLGTNNRISVVAEIVLDLAQVWFGDGSSSTATTGKTLERCRTILGSDHPFTLFTSSVWGLSLAKQARAKEAMDQFDKTGQDCRRALGAEHPVTVFSAAATALSLRTLGEIEAARRLSGEILPTCRLRLGPEHPVTAAMERLFETGAT